MSNKFVGAKNFHTSSERHLTEGERWKGESGISPKGKGGKGKAEFPLSR